MTRAAAVPIPDWVRIGLLALGVPNVLIGLWAVAAPRAWYDEFPGLGPALVAAEPPYNAHLATDAGSGLLASGVVVLLGAWFADTRAATMALVAFAAFAVPHTAYHVLNPAPGLTGSEDLANAGLLVFTVVVTAVLLVAVRRSEVRATSG